MPHSTSRSRSSSTASPRIPAPSSSPSASPSPSSSPPASRTASSRPALRPRPSPCKTPAPAKPVHSSDLLVLGPLVINFFRGRWRPYCVTELETWPQLGHPRGCQRRFSNGELPCKSPYPKCSALTVLRSEFLYPRTTVDTALETSRQSDAHDLKVQMTGSLRRDLPE